MTKYCITAANHNNSQDHRASEFKVWEHKYDAEEKEWSWHLLGRKSLEHVASLLAKNNEVISAKEVKENGKLKGLKLGAPIEIELRIAKNDDQFKITDLPKF